MRKLMLALLVVICLLPAVVLASYRVIDPYYCISLATAQTTLENGHVEEVVFGNQVYDARQGGHLGYPILLSIQSSVAGIPLLSLAFVPIGGVVVPLAFFAVGRRICSSDAAGFLCALFFAFDPSLLPGHYSVFAYTWERVLLASFILIVVTLNDRAHQPRLFILVLLLFIGTFSIYWTTPLIMLVILTGTGILSLASNRQDSARAAGVNHLLTVPILAVIYVWFSRILFSDFIPAVVSEKYGTIYDALVQLQRWLFMGKSDDDPLNGIYATGLSASDLVLMSRYLIIILPVAAYGFVVVKTAIAGRRLQYDRQGQLAFSFALASIIQTLGYSIRGHFSARFLTVLLPLVSVVSMDKIGLNKYRILPLVALVGLVVAFFPISTTISQGNLLPTAGVQNGTHFVFGKVESSSVVLFDLNTYGIYLIEGTLANDSVDTVFYTSELYLAIAGGAAVDDRYVTVGADYVVINLGIICQPVAAPSWTNFKPLSDDVDSIEDNHQLSKVFDDGTTWLLKWT